MKINTESISYKFLEKRLVSFWYYKYKNEKTDKWEGLMPTNFFHYWWLIFSFIYIEYIKPVFYILYGVLILVLAILEAYDLVFKKVKFEASPSSLLVAFKELSFASVSVFLIIGILFLILILIKIFVIEPLKYKIKIPKSLKIHYTNKEKDNE